MESSNIGRSLAALRKTREKTCPICGKVFEAFAKQAYDSKGCANKASYARHIEKRRAEQREAYRRRTEEDKADGDSD
jgi:tRNA(Ile2) C34 agmatinyltransferase TiaS